MRTILEITRQKLTEYEQKYSQWLKDNPGKIMCNYAMNASCCRALIDGKVDDIDTLKVLEKFYRNRHESTVGMNGHWIHAETCKEIILDLYDELV